ncbi:hypothetical protein [Streptomyces prunicolor]|uniref:hypothetical protein n=1 Tax=Streptomyces prunicolor TaxID=67348 RepID=UPI00035C20DE|nr:hypothetical protein [Streptomyces prunicolor]
MDQTTDQTTRYYQFSDGRLREVTITGSVSMPEPEGAVGLSAEEYQAALGVIQAERETARAAREAAEQAEVQAVYLALAAILPDAVARRLSGYAPPTDPVPDPGGVIDLD